MSPPTANSYTTLGLTSAIIFFVFFYLSRKLCTSVSGKKSTNVNHSNMGSSDFESYNDESSTPERNPTGEQVSIVVVEEYTGNRELCQKTAIENRLKREICKLVRIEREVRLLASMLLQENSSTLDTRTSITSCEEYIASIRQAMFPSMPHKLEIDKPPSYEACVLNPSVVDTFP